MLSEALSYLTISSYIQHEGTDRIVPLHSKQVAHHGGITGMYLHITFSPRPLKEEYMAL